MRKVFIILLGLLVFAGCQTSKQSADTIYLNGHVYTVDSAFSIQEAFAVKNGRFLEVSTTERILAKYNADSVIDLQGKSVYPGFYDAHCHFLGYAKSLGKVNLVGTRSFNEVIERTLRFRSEFPGKAWITGRGWDQNDWNNHAFPSNDTLNALFPDIPVLLRRVDGHAAIANQKALELAGITSQTTIEGGMIEVKDGILTGILIDNAVDLVLEQIPEPSVPELITLLNLADKNCRNVGLTTVSDAGLNLEEIMFIDSLQKTEDIRLNVYAMLNPGEAEFDFAQNNGYYQTKKMNVRSFKVYADGALGSRGAYLKSPYTDKPQHQGFLLTPPDSMRLFAKRIRKMNFQMNTHCIGDSANALLLDIYAGQLQPDNDQRWRIEHAQIVRKQDIDQFGEYNIIPSVQPTHCTSDMYWAEKRLGSERLKAAYAYKSLLRQNQRIVHGSDFPVEDINPIYGFYAAITRQDHKGYPNDGFQSEERLTRQEALKAMTIWAAHAAFEDEEKGSLEFGKRADFVVLDQDIMEITPENIIQTRVLQTHVASPDHKH